MGTLINPLFLVCCASGMAFWIVGLPLHLAARARGLREFRNKGYLAPPSGWKLVTFLLRKHYAFFNDSKLRLFFGIERICLLGLLFSLLAAGFLIGSQWLLSLLADMG